MSHDPTGPIHTVFLASPEVLAAWSEHAPSGGELMALSDGDVQHAGDIVARRRPKIVVVEAAFVASTRGVSFLNRLWTDPDMPRVEVRVLLPEHATALTSGRSPLLSSPGALLALAHPLHGRVRRAVRVKMPDGAEVYVDGARAELVDLSVQGAQIVSPTVIKPNQRVRVVLPEESGGIRAKAGVAWSSFELTDGKTRYRVGVEFSEADPNELEAYYTRVSSSAPTKPRQPDDE